MQSEALGTGSPATNRRTDLWRQAQQFEGAFLSEMLRHAGLSTGQSTFGGGAGEEQFASFLREAQADSLTRAGGIGLAEVIFTALVRREVA